jgi:hypothetical protein
MGGRKAIDLTNQRFGRLVVLRRADCANPTTAVEESACVDVGSNLTGLFSKTWAADQHRNIRSTASITTEIMNRQLPMGDRDNAAK